MLKVINKIPYLILLLLSLIIWWNPNFFVPDTYFNIGDALFPLRPELYLKISSNLWSFHDGLGNPNLWPVFLPLAGIVYILHLLKIPLWLINRLWLIIPTAMVGWCTYYLFRSLFKEKYSFICGIIAGIFAMLPPDHPVIPVWYLSLSGFILVLAALYRGLNNFRFRYCVMIAFGVLLLSLNPRFLYLGFFTCLVFLLFGLIINRSFFRSKTIYFLLISFVSALLANSFWIIPFIKFNLQGRGVLSAIYSSPSLGFAPHLDLLLQYRKWANPLYTIRLLTNRPDLPILSYFNLHFIAPFTFLMPVYAFSSIFLCRQKKKILPFLGIASIFILFGTTLYFNWFGKIYRYLWDHFLGFSVLNSSYPWLTFLGIFYAILTGATTLGLLNRIDSSQFLRRHSIKKVMKISLISMLLILICFVYGGGLLIGYTPKENVWGHIIYGNHLPAAKIPEEYFELGRYLSKEENIQKGYRVLNLPWTRGGYAAYNWWHRFTMPDVISFLSSIPVEGISYAPEGVFYSILYFIKEGNIETALDLLRSMSFKYILVHKDYYTVPGVFLPEDFQMYLDRLKNDSNLEKVEQNKYFILFSIKEGIQPAIYAYKKQLFDKIEESEQRYNYCLNKQPKQGGVFFFNGKNYIYVPSSESLNFPKSFSISAWVRLKEDGRDQAIVMKWAASGDINDDYGVFVNKNDRLQVPLNLDGKDFIPSWCPLKKDQWYHIVTIFDSNKGSLTLYLNGVPVGYTNISGTIIKSNTPLLIGANNPNSPSAFFKGNIANIQIYDNPLNFEDIKKLYLSGIKGSALDNRGLKAWWKVLPKKDGTVVDLSGNGNHGVLKGDLILETAELPRFQTSFLSKANDATIKILDLEYRKISPTKYKIGLYSDESFDLVLNQRYHPLWKCYIDGQEVKKHLATPLGLNVWSINRSANSKISLVFKPQIWFNIGILISGIFWTITLCIGIVKFIKKDIL